MAFTSPWRLALVTHCILAAEPVVLVCFICLAGDFNTRIRTSLCMVSCLIFLHATLVLPLFGPLARKIKVHKVRGKVNDG